MSGKLTERKLKALTPRADAQYAVWERVTPGFGVYVSPGGAKTFFVKFRTKAGAQRWKTLGRVGTVTLDEARKRARRDLGLVADDGDPLAARDAARHALTFGEIADRFLTEHVEERRKPSTERLYRLVIDAHLRPTFGTKPIAAIGIDDVAKLHHRLRATPYLANRVVAVLSKLMNWAARQGLRGRGPHVNPCAGLEKYREQPRKRYLTPAELRRLGAALRVGERYGRVSPPAATAVRLLLFTGARVGEILSLKRKAVDLPGRALHLADSKTGPKTIVLNAPALEVLTAWPKFKSPYVFPGEGRGKRKGQHRVDLNQPWAWLRRKARLPDARLHDLRHSFASVAVSSKLTLPIIGALLGHSQPATTSRYTHLLDDPLRAASETTAAIIAAAVNRTRK